ncbi:hypothetical protein HQQ80_16850 [Microbacteriaceae bacterium VKM Ac-2855]|nr:hypothetical protein [Microbacteriaceae bacterium VKM Ac-2855]
MNRFEPYFGVFWGPRELTFGEFITKTREFLEGLRELHPVFGTWFVLGDRMGDEKPLGTNLEHLESLALERGWSTETPKDWFTHLDAHGRPAVDCVVDVGWGFGLVTEPEAQQSSDFVHSSITVGIKMPRVPNHVSLEVRDPASPLLDPAVSERVFRYMIEFWDPDRALVTEQAFRGAVHDPDTKEQLGWLNYRADSSFVDFLPEEVRREPVGTGALFRIGDGRVLGENDLDEVRIGRHIQQTILGHV